MAGSGFLELGLQRMFNSIFSPRGCNVWSSLIQKFSLVFRRRLNVNLSPLVFFSFSMRVNFASRSNWCPGKLKCLSAPGLLGFIASKRWLFKRTLNCHSVFPVYWVEHFLQVSKYINQVSLQFMVSLILYVLLVIVLWKLDVFTTCLQHLLLASLLHGVLLPFVVLNRLTLLFSMVVPPIISFKFLFLRNATIGFSLNFPAILI